MLREAHDLAPRRRPVGVADLQLTSLRRDHVLTLVDDVGIVQHAHGIIPNRDSGYCVDDVARLAVVSLELARRGNEQTWTAILYRALAFLHAAEDEGGMRNFMSYDRSWLDEPHIGDHVGRTVSALGEILATAWIPAVVEPTRQLLGRLVGALEGDVSLRTAAYAVLGLARLDHDRLDPEARRLLERLVQQLADAYESNASDGWSWFEDELTYDNARLLAGAHRRRQCARPARPGRPRARVARWLGDESGLDGDVLRLTGHDGRHRDEAAPGGGDEQPLDAGALVEAELAAFAVTRRRRARRACAVAPSSGSSGATVCERPLYDFATGGCSDGLGRRGVERERRRRVDARVPPRRAHPRRDGRSGASGHARPAAA